MSESVLLWKSFGSSLCGRNGHSSVFVKERNRVYFLGGWPSHSSNNMHFLTSVFDLTTLEFVDFALPNAPSSRACISAAAIGSEIYIFGGELCVHGGTPVKFVKQAMPILLDEMHVLDTNAMSWTQISANKAPTHSGENEAIEHKDTESMESEHILPTPRRGHSLVSTLSSIPQPKTEPDIVDAPKASKDKPKEASKDKPKAKDEVEIPVQQPPKHVLVMFGGETSLRPRQCSNELFMFDVAERTWHRIESIGSIPCPRAYHVACLLSDASKMLIHGGYTSSSRLGDLHVFDLKLSTWSEVLTQGPSPSARCWHSGDIVRMKIPSRKLSIAELGKLEIENKKEEKEEKEHTEQTEETKDKEAEDSAPIVYGLGTSIETLMHEKTDESIDDSLSSDSARLCFIVFGGHTEEGFADEAVDVALVDQRSQSVSVLELCSGQWHNVTTVGNGPASRYGSAVSCVHITLGPKTEVAEAKSDFSDEIEQKSSDILHTKSESEPVVAKSFDEDSPPDGIEDNVQDLDKEKRQDTIKSDTRDVLLVFGGWNGIARDGEIKGLLLNPNDDDLQKPENDIGYGVCIYPNGDKYEGRWKKNKRHGDGICFYANGFTYEGQWFDDERHGQGTLRAEPSFNHTEALYQGAWSHDKRHGIGVLVYSNGDKYVGNWQDDKREGQGVCEYGDGGRYEGQWEDGSRNGRGVMLFANGDVYEGLWDNEKRSKQGTCTYENGDVYEGEWREDLRWGKGVCKYANLDVYEGPWMNNMKNGVGIMRYHNGDYFEGKWIHDKPHGHGILRTTHGLEYDGEFSEGLKHGKGTCRFPNDDIYQGQWQRGYRWGKGECRYNNGSRYNGDWERDQRHGIGDYERWDGHPPQFVEKYHGHWIRDKQSGTGEIENAKGDRYSGYFRDGKRNGEGTMEYTDGSRYCGSWENNVRCGQGVLESTEFKYEGEWRGDKRWGFGICVYADGTQYEGDWERGKKQGKGICRYPDGEVYDGAWQNGVRHGFGRSEYPDGQIYEGEWKNDRRHVSKSHWKGIENLPSPRKTIGP